MRQRMAQAPTPPTSTCGPPDNEQRCQQDCSETRRLESREVFWREGQRRLQVFRQRLSPSSSNSLDIDLSAMRADRPARRCSFHSGIRQRPESHEIHHRISGTLDRSYGAIHEQVPLCIIALRGIVVLTLSKFQNSQIPSGNKSMFFFRLRRRAQESTFDRCVPARRSDFIPRIGGRSGAPEPARRPSSRSSSATA